MAEISLEMAQEIGLVPKANQFNRISWLENRLCSEQEYRQRRSKIVERYCFDKEKNICKFPRAEIFAMLGTRDRK